MTEPRKRGRPPGSRNKHGTPKINVHYRISPHVDAMLREHWTIAATLEEWARLASGDSVALSADVGNLLDALRGEVSRAEFIEQLIRREAEGRKG